MSVPLRLVSSDYATWAESPDIPDWATAAAAVKYAFVRTGERAVEVAATFDGATITAELSAADTAQLAPGTWRLVRIFSEGGKRRSSTARERLAVDPDPLAKTGASFNERMVEALRASLEGRASALLESHTINGQSISKMPVSEQADLLERFEARLRRENERLAIERGDTARTVIYPNFT